MSEWVGQGQPLLGDPGDLAQYNCSPMVPEALSQLPGSPRGQTSMNKSFPEEITVTLPILAEASSLNMGTQRSQIMFSPYCIRYVCCNICYSFMNLSNSSSEDFFPTTLT